MSSAHYLFGGLRFWSEREIEWREVAIRSLYLAVSDALRRINPAWQFHRIEGPVLTPRKYISPAYNHDDIWLQQAKLGEDEIALRPETTASSYVVAKHLLKTVKGCRAPLCVWQAGKSFRREINDGASAAKLRFNEFWQVEFQAIYARDTKADYRGPVILAVAQEIARLGGQQSRIVPSDRLPAYSLKTDDVELHHRGDFREMCSISTRNDFSEQHYVLEVAAGLDRIVSVASLSGELRSDESTQ